MKGLYVKWIRIFAVAGIVWLLWIALVPNFRIVQIRFRGHVIYHSKDNF